MKLSVSILLIFLVSCNSLMVSSDKLVGKWDNSYQIQEKDSSGKWSNWITINTFVALPQLEFTKNGEILYDGKPSEQCCSYLKYTLKDNKIEFSGIAGISENCATVDCYLCNTWTIEKLKDGVLEVNICDNSKIRYLKAE